MAIGYRISTLTRGGGPSAGVERASTAPTGRGPAGEPILVGHDHDLLLAASSTRAPTERETGSPSSRAIALNCIQESLSEVMRANTFARQPLFEWTVRGHRRRFPDRWSSVRSILSNLAATRDPTISPTVVPLWTAGALSAAQAPGSTSTWIARVDVLLASRSRQYVPAARAAATSASRSTRRACARCRSRRRRLLNVPSLGCPRAWLLRSSSSCSEPRRCTSPRRPPLQRELAGLWAARRGPYRVVYEIEDDPPAVRVVRIDHRVDVYRNR